VGDVVLEVVDEFGVRVVGYNDAAGAIEGTDQAR
jgi:hypothetical protein